VLLQANQVTIATAAAARMIFCMEGLWIDYNGFSVSKVEKVWGKLIRAPAL